MVWDLAPLLVGAARTCRCVCVEIAAGCFGRGRQGFGSSGRGSELLGRWSVGLLVDGSCGFSDGVE